MRILIFEQRYTNPKEAGIGRFYYLAKEWAAAGHEVTLVAGMINYITGEKTKNYRWKLAVKEEEEKNFTVIRSFDSGWGYRNFLGRLWSYVSYAISSFLIGLFVPADVVIASSPPIFAGVLGWIVSFFKRAPFVFEVRDLWPDEPVELGFLRSKVLIRMSLRLEKFLYNSSTALVANSPGIKEYISKEKNIKSTKISIIPNPVDLDAADVSMRDKMRQKFGWGSDFVALYTGSMAAVYDFNPIFEAAKEMSDLPFIFAFIGSGRQRISLEKRSKSENILNIKFYNPVPKSEIYSVMAAADLGVISLRKDVKLLRYIYAAKVFDYMAAGIPIVCAAGGVTKELVCSQAKSGICMEPGEGGKFLSAVKEFYENKNLRDLSGKAGRSYVKGKCNAEELAKNYLEAIKQTINRKD